MTRFLYLIALLMTVLMLSSCDERDPKKLPTQIDMLVQPTEEFYLMVEHRKELDYDDYNAWVSLYTKLSLQQLWINDEEVYIEGFSYSNTLGYYNYYLDPDYDTLGYFNDEIPYKMVFSNKTVEGTMRLPSEYFCEPPDFNPNTDFSLQWALMAGPSIQRISYTISRNYDYYLDAEQEFKGSARSTTLTKNTWSKIPNATRIEFTLEASNYRYTEGGLVWYISSAESDPYFEHAAPKDRIRELLEGKIRLPR